MIRFVWICVFLLIFGSSAFSQTIRNISVIRHKVFESGDLPWGTASLFNSIHILSRESVIRRDILFREGEPLDSALIAETERILRNRNYLTEVQIRVIAVESSTEIARAEPEYVDIEVTTRDSWTIELSVAPSGGGGAYSVDLEASDANFRGRGERLKVQYILSDRRPSGLFSFREPALFHPHVIANIIYSGHGDGNFFSGRVGHPFWAFTVPWKWNVSYLHQRDQFLFYKLLNPEDIQLNPAYEYPIDRNRVRFELARAWGREERVTISGAFTWDNQRYGMVHAVDGVSDTVLANLFQFQVPDRIRVGPSVGFDYLRHGYTQGTFFDRFGRIEDLPNQWSAGFRVGRVPRILGSTRARNRWFVQARAGTAAGPLLVSAEGWLNYETDAAESEGSTLIHTQLRLYFKPAIRHVLALNMRHDGWYRSNRQGQMFLGALSGVRGLRARFRAGTRLWYINTEYRYFSPLKILTANLGAVVFGDAGQVWDRYNAPRFRDVEVTWGAGLRLGLAKISADRVLRVDWAKGPDGWITTFGFGMYFNLNLNQPMEF